MSKRRRPKSKPEIVFVYCNDHKKLYMQLRFTGIDEVDVIYESLRVAFVEDMQEPLIEVADAIAFHRRVHGRTAAERERSGEWLEELERCASWFADQGTGDSALTAARIYFELAK